MCVMRVVSKHAQTLNWTTSPSKACSALRLSSTSTLASISTLLLPCSTVPSPWLCSSCVAASSLPPSLPPTCELSLMQVVAVVAVTAAVAVAVAVVGVRSWRCV